MATGGRPGNIALKSESAEKMEFFKVLQLLKIQEQNFDKDKQTHLYAKHGHLYKEMGDIHAEEIKAVTRRKTEQQKLKQQLEKIKNMVKEFQREMKNVKSETVKTEIVERVREIIEDVEMQISNFKDHQKEEYDEILRDERLATQEVSILSNKFDSWSTLGPPNLNANPEKKVGKVASHRDITKDLPPEVAACERFIAQNGGKRGGWDDYDHGTFMKYRNRHKGKPTFIRELIAFLPGKSEEDIRHHELWYQQYLTLNEEKKEAIQKWKENREVEKETLLAQAGQSDSDSEEERKKERLEEIMEQERQERRAQLNKWKVEKELERAEKEERKLREEIEKARKEEADRRLQEEQKAKVQEFRQQREEEKAQRKYLKEVQAQIEYEKRVQATQEVHKYQERDLARVKKKVAKTKAQQDAEKERKQRIQSALKAQNEGHVRRDPSRLLKPTAGWMERQKDTEKSSGQIFHMQHRAVPTWRQT